LLELILQIFNDGVAGSKMFRLNGQRMMWNQLLYPLLT